MQQKIVKTPRWKDGTIKSQGNAFDWQNWTSKALDAKFKKEQAKIMASKKGGTNSPGIGFR